jgi:hypothetical protein
LGFSDHEVKLWFEAAGLEPGDSETVAPPVRGGAEKLTVKVWLAAAREKSAA